MKVIPKSNPSVIYNLVDQNINKVGEAIYVRNRSNWMVH